MLGLIAAMALANASAVPMHRESKLDFTVDEALQADGGVQFFYELAPAEPAPDTASAAFPDFLDFDFKGRWKAKKEPLNVVMSRLVYTLDRDISFFTEKRAKDTTWMNEILPGAEITKAGPDTFRAGKTPANTFKVRWLEGAELEKAAHETGVKRLQNLGSPAIVAVQQNYDFSRVMGWRTGDTSFTWTGHYPLGPGKTRVQVYTLNYLVNLPPGFLGGHQRVFDESVNGAATMIRNLRTWQPAKPH